MLGCLSSDRSCTLYDTSMGSAMQKMTMQTRPNAMCWNPMQPMHFTLASEDHDLYTFDMRKLDHSICVHSGHVSAVLSVDYSPTGQQFVSGSYDKTLRIWDIGGRAAQHVYHAKRMQRLFSVCWSMDASYVFSGSDDTNVRIWRSKPNERAAVQLPREKRKREYSEALVERHKHLPEIRRIKNHSHVPHRVMKAALVKETVRGTQKKKEKNRRAHSAPGKVPKVPRKKKQVWNVQE
uniref:Sof1-like protein domain-containing protein n=1 Tax=Calcidiscus leptoporus TaxID=127549 RepID=A0A7S0IYP7_9EUKA